MPTHQEVIEGLVARAEAAEEDLQEAASALLVYGEHARYCTLYDSQNSGICSCGYDDARRRAYAAADRVRPCGRNQPPAGEQGR